MYRSLPARVIGGRVLPVLSLILALGVCLPPLFADRVRRGPREVKIRIDPRTEPEKEPTKTEAETETEVDRTELVLPGVDTGVQARIGELIAQLDAEPPLTTDDLRTKLIEQGSSSVPCLLQYLTEGTPEKKAIGPAVDAVAALSGGDTVAHLALLLDSPLDVCSAAADALEKIGGRESLEALAKAVMATKLNATFDVSRKALVSILQKNPLRSNYFFPLASMVREEKGLRKIRIVRCFGESRSKVANGVLLSFLDDRERSVKAECIIGIGWLNVGDTWTCSRLRGFLSDDDFYLRKETAMTLGRLKDWDSVPDLIVLLKDENRAVAVNAHWALKQITGLGFPKSFNRWNSWWAAQEKMYATRMDPLLDDLYGGTKGEMLRAIRDLSRIVRGKEEIGNILLEFIYDEDLVVRREVCVALGRMKFTDAIPYLIYYLDGPQQSIKDAAHLSLCRITGRDLPADSAEWRNLKLTLPARL